MQGQQKKSAAKQRHLCILWPTMLRILYCVSYVCFPCAGKCIRHRAVDQVHLLLRPSTSWPFRSVFAAPRLMAEITSDMSPGRDAIRRWATLAWARASRSRNGCGDLRSLIGRAAWPPQTQATSPTSHTHRSTADMGGADFAKHDRLFLGNRQASELVHQEMSAVATTNL